MPGRDSAAATASESTFRLAMLSTPRSSAIVSDSQLPTLRHAACQDDGVYCETTHVVQLCPKQCPSCEGQMAHKPTELRPIMTRLPERLRARLEREAKRN